MLDNRINFCGKIGARPDNPTFIAYKEVDKRCPVGKKIIR